MRTKEIAQAGLMLAVVVVLTTIEHMFTPMPYIKLGLANIIVMYCALRGKPGQAVGLNLLKALFVTLIRGVMAGLLSLSGGLLSVAVIIMLSRSKKASYYAISVSGAICHNLGQILMLMLLLATPALGYYLPILIISGIATGLLTGTLCKLLGEKI